MAIGLESAFSGIAEIYNGFWWIEDSNGEVVIARISYGDLSVEEMTGIDGGIVRKPMTPIDRLMPYRDFIFTIEDFLFQFFTLESRWGRDLDPIPESILMHAARFQLGWCKRSTLVPTDLLDESTMIAAALYCLVVTHNFMEITINWSLSSRPPTPTIVHDRIADVEKDPEDGIYPSVDIWRFAKGAYKRTENTTAKHSLATLLRIILQTTKSIIFRDRPGDELYVFYVLCILSLIGGELQGCSQWTSALRNAEAELRNSLSDLCDMFYISTNNSHPLNSNFDVETYASSVNGNVLLTEHFRALHQLWVDNRRDGTREENTFDLWVNIDRFVNGIAEP